MTTATITRKITSKGQVTIPKQVRDVLHSDFITFEITADSIHIKPASSSIENTFGTVTTPAHLQNKTDNEIFEMAKSARFSKNI